MKRTISMMMLAWCTMQVSGQSSLAALVKDANAKKDTEATEKPVEKQNYDKVITKDAISTKGVMNIHKVKNTYYLEIPMELMGHPLLLAGRVSETSNNKDVIAGQMPQDPIVVEWSCDENKVYLHNGTQKAICDSTESIYKGFTINHIKPVISAFPIKCFTKDSSGVIIDASKFFCADERHLSPFIPSGPFDALFGFSRMKGSFKSDLSGVVEAKAFEKNIAVKTRMVYTVNNEPFTALVTMSMIKLDKEPMRPRIADSRLGFFTDRKTVYSENKDRSERIAYINRWRMEPKEEDIAKWKKGELVEPAKPIVWYIDNAFPDKWRPWLKEGIEDWQMAFEEIGFKNAIVAMDYPENDPEFDPDDIRYSCLRYSAIQTANAMGPSWTDPRSGEIIQGSVYFYHDVLKLLHNWRFIQTAAVDPKARQEVYDMEVMGPLLRYLIVHEIGHTLGLMHNMRGSYAYAVDSLRSPQFLEKYGTTSSIMDYARFNYVAQPEDGVTNFLPPRLGLYDYYIIKWGYKPILEAQTAQEEVAILNAWIDEKKGDPIYLYGEQEILQTVDPASQSESLGDDAVKASNYGIKNLKRITENLLTWTANEGNDYDYTQSMYQEIMRQFNRYIGHVEGYIGGNFLYKNVHGDNQKAFIPVPKEKQQEALAFVINSLREYPEWILDKNITEKLRPGNDKIYDYIANQTRNLVSGTVFPKIGYTAKGATEEERYAPAEYLEDLFDLVWNSENKKELTRADKVIQYAYLHALVGTLDLYDNVAVAPKKSITIDDDMIPCALMEIKYAEERALSPQTKESDLKIIGKTVYYSQLMKVKSILNKRSKTARKADREHYNYLNYELMKALNK
ncbi:MAG: zinc-dependent metalloprotease [Marinifilaceae bacterium]